VSDDVSEQVKAQLGGEGFRRFRPYSKCLVPWCEAPLNDAEAQYGTHDGCRAVWKRMVDSHADWGAMKETIAAEDAAMAKVRAKIEEQRKRDEAEAKRRAKR